MNQLRKAKKEEVLKTKRQLGGVRGPPVLVVSSIFQIICYKIMLFNLRKTLVLISISCLKTKLVLAQRENVSKNHIIWSYVMKKCTSTLICYMCVIGTNSMILDNCA